MPKNTKNIDESRNNLICPVCGKTTFGQPCDYEICKYCGWENDEYFEAGGANELSLEEYKNRYDKYIELKPKYIWKDDGFPEITEEDEYQLAHKFSIANETAIRKSKECGCFFCLKIFDPEEITNWISDKQGRTALCPYCGIDSVLPGSSIRFDRDFLEGMYKLWFK